jgi:methylsterol monooxygenase/4-alpha-methyl-delta7-sterol-4alpha-methyl oxidase
MVHLVVYLTANSFFTLLYILENPLIESWKISKEPWPWKSDPLFKDKLIKVLKSFLLNNTIVIIPLSLLQGLRVNYLTRPEDFPSLSINFFQILFFILVEDCLFYWSHRILHSAYLYKNIHKQHHEFNISISVASEYSHPLEFFIGNIVPVGAGPFILRVLSIDVHILTWFLWITFRSFHTSEGHSGYNLPFSPFRFLPFGVSSRFHDDHHLKNLGNFGSMLVFWDSICGTNQELKSKKD